MRRVALALTGGAALLLAPMMALAQPPAAQVGTYQVPQPGGGSINDCAIQVGALPLTVFHPCHVVESVDQYTVPHPIGPSNPMPISNTQGHADLSAIIAALQAPVAPTGGATSAAQASLLAALNAAATQAHTDAGAIAAAAGAPSLAPGGATSAAQATGNGSLATIASQTAGLATAAGQATSAGNQATELTRLASIATNTASPAFPASGLGAVTSTISAAGASSAITPVAGRGGLHWLISGTGVATCAMEQQIAGSWYPITINGQPFGVISYTGSPVNETSQENGFGIPHRLNCGATNVSGAVNGSFTSGSLAVTLVQP